MPRKVSFEEREIISVVRACGPAVLGVSGSSNARLRRVPSAKSCSFSLNGAMVAPKIGGRTLWLPQLLAGGEGHLQPLAHLLPLSLQGLSRDTEVTSLLI